MRFGGAAMMGRSRRDQGQLFYSFNLEDVVPDDHLVRAIAAATWGRVFHEAAALGVLQTHLSGGEPGARSDLAEITALAHAAGLYTNLITSGVGLTAKRLAKLVEAGLDHIQVSIQDGLENGAPLDPLHQLLTRDYRVLTYLVRHSSRVKLENFEERLLVWDYKVMQFWYGVTKTAAPDKARKALREMATVLTVLSGRIGQRAGVVFEA